MICPICGENVKFSTIDSRQRDWGIKRRKVCPSCKNRIATIEIYKVTSEALKSLMLSQEYIDYRSKERKLNNEKV